MAENITERKFEKMTKKTGNEFSWFALVSIFNGISQFVGYPILKRSLLNVICSTI